MPRFGKIGLDGRCLIDVPQRIVKAIECPQDITAF
jgi:hypothetical protein